MNKPIVILGPMKSESEWLIQQMEDCCEKKYGAFSFYEGTVDGYPVVVCRTFMGVINSAAATALAAQLYDPLCIIVQGTAGAHDPKLHQGDIVLGNRIVEIGKFHSARREFGEGLRYADWTQLSAAVQQDEWSESDMAYYSDTRILDVAAKVPNQGGKVIRGCVGTSDIWNHELDIIAHMHRVLGTDCEENEGFSVAQVCTLFNIPCAVIRIISNSEWHPTEEFNEEYGEQCQKYALDVVRQMIAKGTLLKEKA